jgi:tRNA U34 5-methylaminomethyl-2-thiouridine-forming methyltransferase MnmC
MYRANCKNQEIVYKIVEKEFLITRDGSTTIFLPQLNETYHSKNGAIQESFHVYIKNGLDLINTDQEISILEIGFGTGLNALITFAESQKRNLKINYHTTEAYPLNWSDVELVNYLEYINESKFYQNIHQSTWNETHKMNDLFRFTKHFINFNEINFENQFDLIYFDAFGFDVQPELWTVSQFEKMYKALKINGLLTTYACRSIIIKNMQEAGFTTQKKVGAPGKREMLNAFKGF